MKLEEAQLGIEECQTKQTAPLSLATQKSLLYFNVKLPNEETDLQEAYDHYVNILRRLYAKYFKRHK